MFHDDRKESAYQANPRILGMKPWQAIVLIVFLALDCIVVVAGGYLVMTMTPSTNQPPAASPAQTPTSTQTPVPTETVQSLAGLFPTDTPEGTGGGSPDSTATPTEVGAAGWSDYTSDQLAFQLPESYVAGIPKQDRAAILDALKSRNADQDWTSVDAMIQGASTDTVLVAVDSRTGAAGIITNLQFLYMPVDPAEHMSDIVTRIIGSMAGTMLLVEQRQIINRFYEVEQVTLAPKDPASSNVQVAVYILKDNDVIVAIIGGTSVDEWNARLKEFDQIVRTLQILHPPG
jgi:hypothetical protein